MNKIDFEKILNKYEWFPIGGWTKSGMIEAMKESLREAIPIIINKVVCKSIISDDDEETLIALQKELFEKFEL